MTCPWRVKFENAGLLVLRLLIGLGIAAHGWPKVTGDLEGFAEVIAGKLGLPFPYFFAWAAALSEAVGGILIAIGLGTRLASFFLLCTMATAFFLFHAVDPWEVKEMAFLYGSVALAFIFTGAGCYSLDALIFCRKKEISTETRE